MMLLWPQKWCLILSKEFNKEVHRDILDRKYFWGLTSDYDIWKRILCIVGYTKYSFEAIIINQAIFESLYKPFYQYESKQSYGRIHDCRFHTKILQVFLSHPELYVLVERKLRTELTINLFSITCGSYKIVEWVSNLKDGL